MNPVDHRSFIANAVSTLNLPFPTAGVAEELTLERCGRIADVVLAAIDDRIAEAEKRWRQTPAEADNGRYTAHCDGSGSTPEGATRIAAPLAGGGSNEPAAIRDLESRLVHQYDLLASEQAAHAETKTKAKLDTERTAHHSTMRKLNGLAFRLSKATDELAAERAAHANTRKDVDAWKAEAGASTIDRADLAETKAKLAKADSDLDSLSTALEEEQFRFRLGRSTWERDKINLATAVQALENGYEKLRFSHDARFVADAIWSALRAIRGKQTLGTGDTVAGQQRPQGAPPAGAPGEAGTASPVNTVNFRGVQDPMPAKEPAKCRACGKPLLPDNFRVADGCPCNSPRGVNHGLVAKLTCTCVECDPEQTGSTRYADPPNSKCTCGHDRPGSHQPGIGCVELYCGCEWDGLP